MLAVALLLVSSFAVEVAQSIGKRSIRLRRESLYDLVFLNLFWGLIILVGSLWFGAEWRFDFASLPTLLPRIIIETWLVYLTAEAIAKAERTTVVFLRLLTVPLLLVVDIALGYRLTPWQFLGMGLMFAALFLLVRHNARSKRGIWYAATAAIVNAGAVSLYKYDVTKYNSVAAEQIIVVGTILVVFVVLGYAKHHRGPWRLLVRGESGVQSVSYGAAVAIESFAFSMAPVSILILLKRSFALFWGILFGGKYFREHSIGRKVALGFLMTAGVALIASPQLLAR